MENIVVNLLAADLIKFVVVALAIVIIILCFVIVILSCYIVKLHKEMISKENEFENKLRAVKKEAYKKPEEDDDLEFIE